MIYKLGKKAEKGKRKKERPKKMHFPDDAPFVTFWGPSGFCRVEN